MTLEFSRQIFEKYSSIKFGENSSSGSRVAPCGRTDMMKFTVTFRNFTKAPKTYNEFVLETEFWDMKLISNYFFLK